MRDWREREDAAMLARVPSRDGEPLNIFRVVAKHPPLLRRWAALGTVFLRDARVPPRERELVVLRTGWECGSVYEFGQHTLIGRAEGLSNREIRDLTRPVSEGEWSTGDAALIAMVDEACASDDVTDKTWVRLQERWDEAQLLELVLLVGYYRMVSLLLNATGVPLDAGTPGWPGPEADAELSGGDR